MNVERLALESAGVEVRDCEHKTPPAQEHGYPYIAIPDIQHGRVDFNTCRKISLDDLMRWTRRTKPEPGDVIVTRRGRVGDSAIVPSGPPCAIGQNLVLLRSNGKRIRQDFLRWAVRSPEWHSEVSRLMNVGAVFSSLNVRDIGHIELSMPDLTQQTAIAEVLGVLDDKIAANTRLAQTSDDYLSARLQALVKSEDTEMVPLREIAEVNSKSVKPGEGEIRYIDIASMSQGSLQYPAPMPWRDAPSRARRAVVKQDILWSTVRPARRAHWLNLDDDAQLIASTGIAVISPRHVGFAYLYQALKLPAFTNYLVSVAEGSAYPAVRPDRILSADIPMIPKTARSQFEQLAASLRHYCHHLSRESRTLAELRDTLLPPLMSGRLRVKDAEKTVGNVV